MNPNDFTSVNLDPQKIVAKTVTPDDVVNALNAIAAIKALHAKVTIYGSAYDCAICLDGDNDDHETIETFEREWACPETIEGFTCAHCMDGSDEYPDWPCPTAEAWGEK